MNPFWFNSEGAALFLRNQRDNFPFLLFLLFVVLPTYSLPLMIILLLRTERNQG